MQEPEKPTTSFNMSEPAIEQVARPQSTRLSVVERLENAKNMLPFSPRIIARMVGAWLILFVAFNAGATHLADKPKLSVAEPAGATKIRAQLSADDERRANIDSLAVYVTKYDEMYGLFPSLSQVNSVEFRKADPSFKVANRRTYTDPAGGTASQLVAKPEADKYFYAPTPVGCGTSRLRCSGYTIGATLENGQLYTKTNQK